MSTPSTLVLMIDDDKDDAFIVQEMLNEAYPGAYRLEWLDQAESALFRLKKGDVDIILLDYRLGGALGTDWIPRFKEASPCTPVLLLTGQGGPDTDRIAMSLGASDYLVKGDFSAEALHRMLFHSIEREAVLSSLSQSEELYRHLFEDHPSACLLYDACDLTILSANRAALHLYGKDIRQSAFNGLFENPEQDWPNYLRFLHSSLPATRNEIWQHRNARGKVLDVELVDTPFRFHHRKARLVVAMDKSTEVQSERQARESESALLQLLADSQDAILALDNNSRLQYANPSAEKLLGLETTPWDKINLSLPETDENLFEWTLTTESEPRTFEVVRSHTKLGGHNTQILSMRNITERLRLEAQRRLLERSLASTSNGIVICDARQPDHPISYVNPAFEKMTGYTSAEILGRNCRFLQGNDTNQPGVELIRNALQQQQSVSTVLRNYRADGSAFWNDLFISPVQDDQGEVTHFVGIQNDISAQREVEHTLAYNASHDVLTGLPNRTLLEDRIRQSLLIARRCQKAVAVLYIDLDGFKPLNDTLGHTKGDWILLEVAHRIESIKRGGDTLARLSADEFVLVLPDIEKEGDCLPIIERVLARISEPYILDDGQFHLTASIGIALSQDIDEEDPMYLVRQADLAMFEAKENGKNQYSWYTPSLDSNASRALQLRGDLQRAINNNEFRLHYQPVHNLKTGEITCFEALLRWSHPQLGAISPGDFIPIAETTGQIIALSQWVLEQACRDRQQLERLGIEAPIALNLSPMLFKQENLAERMAATVHKHGLDCQSFELEVLESVMMSRFELAIESLSELKTAGFGLSIDDFGTGFSSLSYLKLLPIHKIKIDRSFITDIIKDQDDTAIVRAIISMARHLGLRVVAEGVETEAQAAFLKRESCDDAQGFLYSAARPLTDLLDYIISPPSSVNSAENAANIHNILILDDDPLILKSLNRTLRNQGYGVFTANNADQAFSILAQESIQVVLSDQRMPEMSGTEFLKKVRSLYPSTIRIVLSGYTDLATVTGAINEGAIYQFLTKPWNDDELRAIIHRAFEESGLLSRDS